MTMPLSRPKKYLVTGGSGFIGSALVRYLVGQGHQVRILDDGSRGAERRLEGALSKVEMVRGDIRDAACVRRAAEGMDSICHLAFINGTEFFYTKPDLVLEVGVKGIVNVLDACESAGVGELILASSSEVYQTPPQVPTDETVPLSIPDALNPRYSYGAGKIISEMMALNYGRKRLRRVVIFRPHNVYGPDMGWEHVIPEFVMRMKKSLKEKKSTGPMDFPILGTGLETRSFIYIEDFTRALGLVLERGEHLGIYHLGTEEEKTIRQVAEEVGRCLGAAVNIVSAAPAPPGGTLRRCPDIQKIKKLGFKPEFSFEAGLKKTVAWYDQNLQLAPAGEGR